MTKVDSIVECSGVNPLDASTENTWIRKNDLPISTYYNSACSLNGKIYHFGGSAYSNRIYEYDPETDSYTRKTNSPISVYRSEVVAYDDLIYVANDDGYFYSYEPINQVWTKLTSPSNARIGSGMVVYNDELYVFGSRLCVSSVEKYNFITNTWTSLNSMPYSTGYCSANVIGDKCYIIGGDWSHNNDYLIYDFETDTYTKKSTPAAFCYHRAETIGDEIYVIGGFNNYSHFYKFNGETWTNLENVPVGIDKFASASIDGVIYTFGGENSYSSRVYQYTTNWIPPDSTTFFLYEIDGVLYNEVDGELVKLPDVELSEENMIKYGTNTFNKDLLTTADHIKLHIYEQDPSIVEYNFNYTLIYKGQTIVQDYDFDATNVDKLTITATVNANDELKFLFSNDSGTTWYTLKDGAVTQSTLETIAADGLSHIQVNALTAKQLTDLLNGSTTLRLAIYMKQAKSSAALKLDHIRLSYIPGV